VKFYSSDWLAGTSGLTVAEKGVFITLCALIYEHGGPVAHDSSRLARRCGCPKVTFEKILASLIDEGKVTLAHGHLTNDRCESEIMGRKNRSENARALAEKRWGAPEEKPEQKQPLDDADAMPTHMRTRTITIKEVKEENKPLTPFDVLSEVLPEDLARDFIAHRKSLRKPMTDRAAAGVVKSLREVAAAGHCPSQAIETAIERGWLTAKLEWISRTTADRKTGGTDNDRLGNVLTRMRAGDSGTAAGGMGGDSDRADNRLDERPGPGQDGLRAGGFRLLADTPGLAEGRDRGGRGQVADDRGVAADSQGFTRLGAVVR
jgi:uncharacterized protein YdaU (DUF1376 family)